MADTTAKTIEVISETVSQLRVNQGFLFANVKRATGNPNPRWDTTQQLRGHGIVGDIRQDRISWCDFDWLFADTPQNRQVLTANGIHFDQKAI